MRLALPSNGNGRLFLFSVFSSCSLQPIEKNENKINRASICIRVSRTLATPPGNGAAREYLASGAAAAIFFYSAAFFIVLPPKRNKTSGELVAQRARPHRDSRL